MRHGQMRGGATEDCMALGECGVPKAPLRIMAVLAFGIWLSGCSTVPSWLDPTSWLGPDVSNEAQADSGQYPDLSNMPNRPQPASTPDQQQQVANSLQQARNNVQYSAEQLRGGTAAAAPPPAPPAPAAQVARVERETMPSAQQSSQPAPKPAAPKAAPVTRVASAAEPAVPTSTGARQPAVPAVPAYTGSRQPAVPAVPAYASTSTGSSMAAVSGIQPAVRSDASLGFEPSRAPALDSSIAEFVPQPVIARYDQTASIANVRGTAMSAVPALKPPKGVHRSVVGTGDVDVGGPEAMSGAVVANLGVLSAVQSQASVYASPSGLPPAAVVHFANDGIRLNAAGRAQVRQAVNAYRARGSRGYVRVVGHSSSRTANMSFAHHMELNFRKSEQRAEAVARALIRAGIPANKVLVQAVGASQPVYYESMPKGEAGNRRAEIFLQG